MDTSLKGLIQSICEKETVLYVGKVISKSPLKIKMQDDTGLTVGAALLKVPEHLTDRKVKMKIDGDEQEVTVYEALSAGDTVCILSVGRSTEYIVLGRC